MRRPGPPDEDPDATVVRPGRRPAPPGLALRTDERTEVRTEERTVVRPAPIDPDATRRHPQRTVMRPRDPDATVVLRRDGASALTSSSHFSRTTARLRWISDATAWA